MLERSGVVARYRELLSSQSPIATEVGGWLEFLPPFLCRSLILGSKLSSATRSFDAALSGNVSSRHLSVGPIRMCADGFSKSLFSKLPLHGHAPLEVPGLAGWLEAAIDFLSDTDPDTLNYLSHWCSTVLWVAPSTEFPADTLLTSVAIPVLPHCVIVSVKSLRHIPAKHVYEGGSIYALAENLYHEALHQQLTSTLIFGPPFMAHGKDHSKERVSIPWRDTSWEIDRVLHASWVYVRLQSFRQKVLQTNALSGPERQFLSDAYEQSQDQVSFLSNALNSRAASLSTEGQSLVESILCETDV